MIVGIYGSDFYCDKVGKTDSETLSLKTLASTAMS